MAWRSAWVCAPGGRALGKMAPGEEGEGKTLGREARMVVRTGGVGALVLGFRGGGISGKGGGMVGFVGGDARKRGGKVRLTIAQEVTGREPRIASEVGANSAFDIPEEQPVLTAELVLFLQYAPTSFHALASSSVHDDLGGSGYALQL